jgi:hypothetical protein
MKRVITHPEYDVQCGIIAALAPWPMSRYLFAIQNGGNRNVKQAVRAKAFGEKPGVSDLFFALPVGRFSGLWIEVKRPDIPGKPRGVLSKHQVEFLMSMSVIGYGISVVRSAQEGVVVIQRYCGGDHSNDVALMEARKVLDK